MNANNIDLVTKKLDGEFYDYLLPSGQLADRLSIGHDDTHYY